MKEIIKFLHRIKNNVTKNTGFTFLYLSSTIYYIFYSFSQQLASSPDFSTKMFSSIITFLLTFSVSTKSLGCKQWLTYKHFYTLYSVPQA